MKRILVILGVFVLVMVVATVIALYLALRLPSAPGSEPGVDAIPDESRQEPPPDPVGDLGRGIASLLGVDADTAGITAEIVQEVLRDGEADMSPEQLVAITTTALSGTRDGRTFLAAAEPLRARIEETRVHMSSILDLGELDTDAMSPSLGEPLERLLVRVPLLSGRRIYVEMSTLPVASAGDLDLGTHAGFQVGSLPLPRFLTRAAGLDQERLAHFTIDLRFLDIEEVTVQPDTLLLRARPSLSGARP